MGICYWFRDEGTITDARKACDETGDYVLIINDKKTQEWVHENL